MAVTLDGEEVYVYPSQQQQQDPLGKTDGIQKVDIESAQSLPPYEKNVVENRNADPFGNEDSAEVKYKVLTWW